MSSELSEWTGRLITKAFPTIEPTYNCLYFAIAATTALGTGWRFMAGAAFLPTSQITGWGISLNPRLGQYYVTADTEVDEDGMYCGHCWAQGMAIHDSPIVDLQEGYYGPTQRAEGPVVYHAIPKLTRSIKTFYAAKLTTVAKEVRQDRAFVLAVRKAAEAALEECRRTS